MATECEKLTLKSWKAVNFATATVQMQIDNFSVGRYDDNASEASTETVVPNDYVRQRERSERRDGSAQ